MTPSLLFSILLTSLCGQWEQESWEAAQWVDNSNISTKQQRKLLIFLSLKETSLLHRGVQCLATYKPSIQRNDSPYWDDNIQCWPITHTFGKGLTKTVSSTTWINSIWLLTSCSSEYPWVYYNMDNVIIIWYFILKVANSFHSTHLINPLRDGTVISIVH